MPVKLTNFNIETLKDKKLYVYHDANCTNLHYIINFKDKLVYNKHNLPMYRIAKIQMRKSVEWEVKLKCSFYASTKSAINSSYFLKLCVSLMYVTKHIKDGIGKTITTRYYYVMANVDDNDNDTEIKNQHTQLLSHPHPSSTQNERNVITFMV